MKKILAIIMSICFLVINQAKSDNVASYIPQNPQNALILVHGFGQSGNRMSYMTDNLKNIFKDTAFYYPTAPDKAPYGGYQWFVLPAIGNNVTKEMYKQMLDNALNNVKYLHKLIEEIHTFQNIPYENINIAGFSQGGLMAVLTVLTNKNRIGRAISFSGVPLVKTDIFNITKPPFTTDILLIQGTNDDVVPLKSINMTIDSLKTLNITPHTATIKGMGHQINHEALQKMIDFLQ